MDCTEYNLQSVINVVSTNQSIRVSINPKIQIGYVCGIIVLTPLIVLNKQL